MRSEYKRLLAAMLTAAMCVMPAFSSLAAEEPVFPAGSYQAGEGFFPADVNPFLPGEEPAFGEWGPNNFGQDTWNQNGWGYGLASPSDMFGGFMPGAFPAAPEDMWGVPGGFADGFGGAGDEESGSPFPPDMMPPADQEDHYIITEAEADDLTAEEAEAEEEIDAYVYEDAEYYAKLLVYKFNDMAPADELLDGYISEMFYGRPDDTLFTDYWRSTLSSDERGLYDHVREFIGEIAAAEEGYPVFDASGIVPTLRLSRESLGLSENASNTDWYEAAMNYYLRNAVNARRVMNCVYLDSPYDLYWADTSYIVSFVAYIENGYCMITMPELYFPAGSGYEGDYVDELGKYDIYYISNDEILRAEYAADIARTIAEDHEGESGAEMLASFMEEINELAPYDSADEDDSGFGDPWQIVYVFDTDPSTPADSEGYAKAFQYLCDMCGFEDCYTVTGKLSGRGHMWNVVSLDGIYYIVDLAEDDPAGLIPVGSQTVEYVAGD